jgi:hypothetical protein
MSDGSTSSGPGPTPQQSAVRKVQRAQQSMIRLNSQYSRVLAGFNLALDRLSTHLFTLRGSQPPRDPKTAQLAAQVDRLAFDLTGLTRVLDELVVEFSAGHEELASVLGLRSGRLPAGGSVRGDVRS